MLRLALASVFAAVLVWAQFRAAGLVEIAATLEIVTGMPARIYLFKDGKPFRLSPVDALLPLRVDLFYRERLWRLGPSPRTLEVTSGDESHFLLLDGRAEYDLPQGSYRVEAYRGTLHKPASAEFRLKAGERRNVTLTLEPLAGARDWLAGDDHIHLTRAPEDDTVFLKWLEAEDLAAGNFLQLQRQMDASVQYGFGDAAEARGRGYSIRSGHESRSHHYGHINLLGASRILRPLSVGEVYANAPGAFPFPAALFEEGRKLGAVVGYAHFEGSQPHSTLLMDLALGTIDFTEVFQFGVLKMDAWYELLNAGLRVTGIAGSDFPVPLNRARPWPRAIPLLGPERTFVKTAPGASAYKAWAEGVRSGRVVVSNGPLLDLRVNGHGPGETLSAPFAEGEVTVISTRPILKMEIVANGRVVASRTEGHSLTFRVPLEESAWIAARAQARNESGEPEIWAHTNPIYVRKDGKPVHVPAARKSVAARWRAERDYYRSANLPFDTPEQSRLFQEKADQALRILEAAP